MRAQIHGRVSPRFEPVRATLEENFAARGEWGCAVAVWHRGSLVVDLWGGKRSLSPERPWTGDTLSTIFSCTKGLVALAFAMAAERGQIDYEAAIAHYWPEFAQGGKESISVRMLLNHRSGLVGLRTPIKLSDLEHRPELISRILERETPHWQPGTQQGYHAVTFGLVAQELFQRCMGKSLGQFIAEEIAAPLAADVYLGLPGHLERRVAVNYPATAKETLLRVIPKTLFTNTVDGRVYRRVALGRTAALAIANPKELGPLGIDNFNSRRVRALELPWGNAVASARGLARVYAAIASGGTLDGVRLLGPKEIEPLLQPQSWSERDRVLSKPVGWSQGFLKEEANLFSPNPRSFGHAGAGGSLGWCDPDEELAIAYITNKMDHRIRSQRTRALCAAIYRSLR
jgi:CubicO group peptidase (beta-lactamase class C family)